MSNECWTLIRGGLSLAIFSWLFSKNTENNSQVRKWVNDEMERVDLNNPDEYALFLGLIHIASQWGKYNVEEQDNQFYQVSKQYLGDATIFEVACYTYFRLENWLAENQPDLKANTGLPIRKWIEEKFSLTFYLNEGPVNQLLTGILEEYQAALGSELDLPAVHLVLEKRILMTKGNKFDKRKLPKELAGLSLDSQYIKNSLVSYEEIHIPILVGRAQDYCEKYINKQVKKAENQPQSQEEKDYLYGMALVAQGDGVRACKALTKAITANPKHYDALLQRGLVYITLYQPVDAVQDFTRAIGLKPNEAMAYIYRGKCYHRNFRQSDQSLADYSTAIRLEPMNIAGYLGELYDDLALRDEKQASEANDHAKTAQISEEFLAAIDDYNQVITLDPNHDIARVNRALLYARKARVTKNIDFAKHAIADFEQAISLNWEHGYLYKQQDEMTELVGQGS